MPRQINWVEIKVQCPKCKEHFDLSICELEVKNSKNSKISNIFLLPGKTNCPHCKLPITFNYLIDFQLEGLNHKMEE